MAHLTRETLKWLAQLSRINCSPEEEEKLLTELANILAYVDQLQELDTEGVPPCNHVIEDIANVMRDDEVGNVLPRETFLANAPSHTGGMIKVPPVIKGKNS